MKYRYENFSYVIFMGFYESILLNCDTENEIYYYLSQDDERNIEYELDYDTYKSQLGAAATQLLFEIVNNTNIIKSMKFLGIDSPKYYNFETDKLCIDIDLNLCELKKFIFKNKDDFNFYLKATYTSYDGFMSFVANNFEDFMKDYKDKKERYISVMIEFYLLTQIYNTIDLSNIYKEKYNTLYHDLLFEKNWELLLENTAVKVNYD